MLCSPRSSAGSQSSEEWWSRCWRQVLQLMACHFSLHWLHPVGVLRYHRCLLPSHACWCQTHTDAWLRQVALVVTFLSCTRIDDWFNLPLISTLMLLVAWQEGHPAWWWGAGVVSILGRGADLHKAQLIPLPLTVSCSSKSRLILPFWYRLTWVVPDKGPLTGCKYWLGTLWWYCCQRASMMGAMPFSNFPSMSRIVEDKKEWGQVSG